MNKKEGRFLEVGARNKINKAMGRFLEAGARNKMNKAMGRFLEVGCSDPIDAIAGLSRLNCGGQFRLPLRMNYERMVSSFAINVLALIT